MPLHCFFVVQVRKKTNLRERVEMLLVSRTPYLSRRAHELPYSDFISPAKIEIQVRAWFYCSSGILQNMMSI